MRFAKAAVLFFSVTFVALMCFAQDAAIPTADFAAQVLDAVAKLGGLSGLAKVSAILVLIISSMKVTALNDLIWNKLGKAQKWVAPVLAIIGGIVAMAAGGAPITFAGVMAYLGAGLGAPYLHDLLDLVKTIPGIGPTYLMVIDVIIGALPKSLAASK